MSFVLQQHNLKFLCGDLIAIVDGFERSNMMTALLEYLDHAVITHSWVSNYNLSSL